MRDFFRPTTLGRGFMFKTWLLVWGVRLGLWLLPFRTMRKVVERLGQPPTGLDRPRWPVPQQISWAVTITSRYVPSATCLTQAMTAKILLGRYGHQANLRIGVTRSEAGEFQAHAWVENDSAIVIGGDEAELAEKYVMLPALEGNRQ